MKHVLQTTRNTTTGNCLNAAIASILEIELESIPAFNLIQDEKEWWKSVQEWAATIGFQLLYITLNEQTTLATIPEHVHCILVGKTAQGNRHAVVGYAQGGGGGMTFMQLHDPLDKNGVESVDGVIYFTPVSPEKLIKRYMVKEWLEDGTKLGKTSIVFHPGLALELEWIKNGAGLMMPLGLQRNDSGRLQVQRGPQIVAVIDQLG